MNPSSQALTMKTDPSQHTSNQPKSSPLSKKAFPSSINGSSFGGVENRTNRAQQSDQQVRAPSTYAPFLSPLGPSSNSAQPSQPGTQRPLLSDRSAHHSAQSIHSIRPDSVCLGDTGRVYDIEHLQVLVNISSAFASDSFSCRRFRFRVTVAQAGRLGSSKRPLRFLSDVKMFEAGLQENDIGNSMHSANLGNANKYGGEYGTSLQDNYLPIRQTGYTRKNLIQAEMKDGAFISQEMDLMTENKMSQRKPIDKNCLFDIAILYDFNTFYEAHKQANGSKKDKPETADQERMKDLVHLDLKLELILHGEEVDNCKVEIRCFERELSCL